MAKPPVFHITFLFVLKTAFTTRVFLDMLKEVNYDINADPSTFHHHRGQIRPAPSDKLPVVDLIENPNTMFDPPAKELNHRKLRKMLGIDFDPEYMGIGRPIIAVFQPNGTVAIKTKYGRPKGLRPSFIENFGKPIRYGNQVRIPGLNLNRRTKRNIKKYVWNYTHCPVVYAWKDLGIRFWPQWIKEGKCYSVRSCSIPPGMSCQQKGSETRTIFRWHCTVSKKNQITNCKWLKIHYPIITECACSC